VRASLTGNFRFGITFGIVFENAAGMPATVAGTKPKAGSSAAPALSPVHTNRLLSMISPRWAGIWSLQFPAEALAGLCKQIRRKSRQGGFFSGWHFSQDGYVNVSAQIFLAQFIAKAASCSFMAGDTPPEPGTAFIVLSFSSYL
jgi:hypothetical protein